MYTRQIGKSQRVVTEQGPAVHRVHLIGPHPILNHFLAKMNFQPLVRSCLGTRNKGILDHAQMLSVFVQNIILSPAPLYRIAEWANPIDPPALGLSAREMGSLNDDRVARSLEALSCMRAGTLFFQLALQTIKQFELDTQHIHHDTTSLTFSGVYKKSQGTPRITWGHNKDHRPDLKQLVFGLNVTSDGAVPISHDIYSGNRTDDTIHCGNIDKLRQILHRSDFIYVADSKLATRKNLAHVAEYGGSFVTLLPRTRNEDKGFRKVLRQGASVRWRKILEIEDPRSKHGPPVVYSSTADGPKMSIECYRIIWIKSSQKAKIDALARETSLDKAEAELFDFNTRLGLRKVRSYSGIQKKVKGILAEHKCQRFLDVRIACQTSVQFKYLRPGRPQPGDPMKKISTKVYHLVVARKKMELRAEARTDGIFPLVTNLDPQKAPKREVLRIYKYQPYVEKRHALFKSELEVAPVYVKKPNRVVGLIHAVYLGMVVDALIERTVRLNMTRSGIESIPILPEGRETKTPTTARILEMFSDICWYEFERGEEIVTFPIELSVVQKQLLKLLEMDSSAYS